MRRISDEHVDAITFAPNPGRGFPLRVGGEPDEVLAAFVGMQTWSFLRSWLRVLAEDSGGGYNDLGFSFDTDELWPGDEPFTGVKVFVPWGDEVVISRPAFDRLMRRLYTALLVVDDPARREPWWPEFAAAARKL